MFRAVSVMVQSGSGPVEVTTGVPIDKPCTAKIKVRNGSVSVGDSPSTCCWGLDPNSSLSFGIEPGDKIWADNQGASAAVVSLILFSGR